MLTRSTAVVCVCIFSLSTSAQITLEHSYPNAATGPGMDSELSMVHLETLGDRWVEHNKEARMLYMYDLSHALVLTIDLAGAPDVSQYAEARDIMYVTQFLFDLDDGIELMYITQSPGQCQTSIIQEDASVLQSWPNEGPFLNLNSPQEQRPIYNTSVSGAKLVLSNWVTLEAKVYSLPGSLNACPTNTSENMLFSASMRVYPDPSAGEIVVDLGWQLQPNGATIELLNPLGEVILSERLRSSEQRVSLSSLAAGRYTYRILVNGMAVGHGSVTKL